MDNQEKLFQLQGHLFNMANQIENIEAEIKKVLEETEANNNQINVLTQHFVYSDSTQKLYENLAELATQTEENNERIENLAKAIKKISRTQYKSNALGESKEKQIQEAIDILNDIVKGKETIQKAKADKAEKETENLKHQARAEFAADFIPVLDGIEMALEHGNELLEKGEKRVTVETKEEHPNLIKKILMPLISESKKMENEIVVKYNKETNDSLIAWLNGLEIVQSRFLKLLKMEGIEQLDPIGEQFNPHYHVAVKAEVHPELKDNRIIEVRRKGYIRDDKVLRYAEVVVVKPKEKETPEPPNVDIFESKPEPEYEPDIETEETEEIEEEYRPQREEVDEFSHDYWEIEEAEIEEEQEPKIEDAEEIAEKFEPETEKTETVTEKYKPEIKRAERIWEDYRSDIEAAENTMKEHEAHIEDAEEIAEKHEQEIEKAQEIAEKYEPEIKRAEEIAKKYPWDVDETDESIDEYESDIEEDISSMTPEPEREASESDKQPFELKEDFSERLGRRIFQEEPVEVETEESPPEVEYEEPESPPEPEAETPKLSWQEKMRQLKEKYAKSYDEEDEESETDIPETESSTEESVDQNKQDFGSAKQLLKRNRKRRALLNQKNRKKLYYNIRTKSL
jgi:molecular chaperone GrpE